jgi:DNA-binding CsgD family transcriptional regulator
MKQASFHQLIEFMEIARDLSCESDLDIFRREILNCIDDYIPSDRSLIVLENENYHSPDFFIRNINEKKNMEYLEYYYSLDPFSNVKGPSQYLQLVPCLPHGKTVITLEEIVNYPDFMCGEYYRDFLKPQNIHYELEIYLKQMNRIKGFIALLRPRRSQSFSDREISFARAFAPFLSLALDNILLNKNRNRNLEIARSLFNLSKRQLDVVKFICEGLTNREIAERLGISDLTVKSHIQNLFEKTGVNSRSSLVYKIIAGV